MAVKRQPKKRLNKQRSSSICDAEAFDGLLPSGDYGLVSKPTIPNSGNARWTRRMQQQDWVSYFWTALVYAAEILCLSSPEIDHYSSFLLLLMDSNPYPERRSRFLGEGKLGRTERHL